MKLYPNFLFSVKRTTFLGLSITGLWIAFALWLLSCAEKSFFSLDLNAQGDFLAGVISPAAFLWLVLGYFQQGVEIGQNTEAIQLQGQELALQTKELRESVEAQKAQADAVSANTQHAALDVYIRLTDILLNRLYQDVLTIAELLKERNVNETYEENYARQLASFRQGFTDGFVHRVLTANYKHSITASPPKIYFNISKNRFCKTFELLIQEAVKIDSMDNKNGEKVSFVSFFESTPLKSLYDKLKATSDLE